MTTSKDLISAEQVKKNAFDHALHRSSTKTLGGIRSMVGKDNAAHVAAVDEYFQHWDGKKAEDETDEIRQARTADYASLTRQYIPTHSSSTLK